MNYQKLIFVSLILLLFSFTVKANHSDFISIDKESNSLIAPKGANYQWFKDGVLYFGANSQTLKASESGEYTVVYLADEGKIAEQSIQIAKTSEGIRRVFLIGDSTVQNYSSTVYPMMGWGQVLPEFFDSDMVSVHNRAIGGRSSRSFYEEGRWDNVKAELQSGDFVFIQFGHNDRDSSKPERYTNTTDFKTYLQIYVDGCREKNAIPVLVSPMLLNSWNGETIRNVFTEGSNDYRGAMLEVATNLSVHFIDLNKKSEAYLQEVGRDVTGNFLYMMLPADEYDNYSGGSGDFTHFQEMGAYAMAKLVTDGIEMGIVC
jgi:lysophospholipase L1-like esterase